MVSDDISLLFFIFFLSFKHVKEICAFFIHVGDHVNFPDG